MSNVFIPSTTSSSIRITAPVYSRISFDKSMAPQMAIATPGKTKETTAIESIKKSEESAKNFINGQVATVSKYVDTLGKYTDTYFNETSLVKGLSPKSADLSSTILRASGGKYNYLKDTKTNNTASWEWNSFKIQVPESVVTPLEAVQGIVSTISDFVKFIKSALEALKAISLNITDIIKAIIDSAVSALISVLDIFRVDASLHLLAIPPVVPKFTLPRIEAQYNTATKIVGSARQAIDLVSDFYKSNGIPAASSGEAGSKGLYSKIYRKTNDIPDINRPQFQDSDYIAGGLILVGGGMEYVFYLYSKLAELFSIPSKKYIDFLPKQKKIDSAYLSIDNSKLWVNYTDYNLSMSKVNHSQRYKVLHEVDICIIRLLDSTADREFSAIVESIRTSEVYLLDNFSEYSKDVNTSKYLQVVAEKTANSESNGVYVVPILSSNITKSIYSYQAAIQVANLPAGARVSVHINTLYIYSDSSASEGNTLGSLNLVSQPYSLVTSQSGVAYIDYGKGIPVGWVRAGSTFDLIPVLGYLRDLVNSVASFLNSFLSDIGSLLDSIIRQLSSYLDYIVSILSRINSFLELLKSLASIGTGAAISLFQGYGGNKLLDVVLKDMLVNASGTVNSSGSSDRHRSIVYGQPISFGPTETAAGIVLVAGSEQLDSVINLVSLLKLLFTSDSSAAENYKEAANLLQTIGTVETTKTQPELPDNSMQKIIGIPGGYTSSMTPAISVNSIQEDYCHN
jgi:hypothetical protein